MIVSVLLVTDYIEEKYYTKRIGLTLGNFFSLKNFSRGLEFDRQPNIDPFAKRPELNSPLQCGDFYHRLTERGANVCNSYHECRTQPSHRVS